jgi:hypothetical protein
LRDADEIERGITAFVREGDGGLIVTASGPAIVLVRGSRSQNKIVLTSSINRLLTSLSECKLAENDISNSGANVVMYSDVAIWRKREFDGA